MDDKKASEELEFVFKYIEDLKDVSALRRELIVSAIERKIQESYDAIELVVAKASGYIELSKIVKSPIYLQKIDSLEYIFVESGFNEGKYWYTADKELQVGDSLRIVEPHEIDQAKQECEFVKIKQQKESKERIEEYRKNIKP